MQTSRVERALRVALVVYLSPAILAVMAVGCVGLLFSRREAKPGATRPALAHAAQRTTPIGIGKAPAKARELV